jgi:predicted ester cyclase
VLLLWLGCHTVVRSTPPEQRRNQLNDAPQHECPERKGQQRHHQDEKDLLRPQAHEQYVRHRVRVTVSAPLDRNLWLVGARPWGATAPITSSVARRCPGSRVAGGQRVATRSALDARCRRANPRGSGRRLGGSLGRPSTYEQGGVPGERGLRRPGYVVSCHERTSVEATVDEGVVAMSDDIKALASRIPLEVENQGKLEVLDEVLAPDFIDHAARPGSPPGGEGVKAYIVALLRAFPDLNISINRQIAEGDLVVTHGTYSGTMTGEFAGMPPSGKQMISDGIHIVRVRDGKLVEHWAVVDELGMLQQLGFIEVPSAAETAG